MARLQLVALLAVSLSLTCAKPPPGFVKKPDTDEAPLKYEFGYSVSDGGGGAQGHLESREGELARGMFFVRLPGDKDGDKTATQEVKYLADDWGFHPLVQYRSASPHGASSASFALGERAVAALRKQQEQQGGAVEDAADSALSTIEAVSKTLKSQASISNAVGEQLQVFGTKSPAPAAPVALPLVASSNDAAHVPSSGTQPYSEEAATDAAAYSQQSTYGTSGGDSGVQTTVGQPVSNLLVQLPQVTYQTSFDASGSAITYTQVPDSERSRLYSSQSGHYRFVTGTLPQGPSGLPTAQQVLVVNEQQIGEGGSTVYGHSDVVESSSPSPTVSDNTVQLSYHKESSSVSSSSETFNQETEYVSSTPAPIIVADQTAKPEIEATYNSFSHEQLVSSTATAKPDISYNAISQEQLVTTLDTSAGTTTATASTNPDGGVLHLKYSSKNNGGVKGSESVSSGGYRSHYITVVPSGVSPPEQVAYVTATGGGDSQYVGGGRYAHDSYKNQVQGEEAVSVTAYGEQTNSAAAASQEFGIKIRPSLRAKAVTSLKEAVQLNEVHSAQESFVHSTTSAPPSGPALQPPRPSMRPIVVAELGSDVAVVTPSATLAPEASNAAPAVVYSSAAETPSADAGGGVSYPTTVAPVVVTPQAASGNYVTTATTTVEAAVTASSLVEEEQKEVIITPRPDPAQVSSKESGGRISATLPQVGRTSTYRRQFKHKHFGLRTSKSTTASLLPTTTVATPTKLTPSASTVTEKNEEPRTKTIVEIQKAIPYEFPVENVYSQGILQSQSPVYIPQAQILSSDPPQTVSYPIPYQQTGTQSSQREPVQTPDIVYKQTQSEQSESQSSGTQIYSSIPQQNLEQQRTQTPHSELTGSQLLLATLLEDHQNKNQKQTYAKPQLIQFRPQADVFNPEFLNQIQIASAQSLLQAIQYETLRARESKERKLAENQQTEGEQLPVALPLVRYLAADQQTLQQQSKPIQAESARIESTFSPNTEKPYESDVSEIDDSTIFDIAKKVKQEQEFQSINSQGKKSKIQSLLESERETSNKKEPQIVVTDKETYTNAQLENLQKEIQAGYKQYLDNIDRQIAQSQQYFGYISKQPISFGQGQAQVDLQLVNIQAPNGKQETVQFQDKLQGQQQQQQQLQLQEHRSKLQEQYRVQGQEQPQLKFQEQATSVQNQQLLHQQPQQPSQSHSQAQIPLDVFQQLVGAESQTHAVVSAQNLGGSTLLKHGDKVKQVVERPVALGVPQPIAVPLAQPQPLPLQYAVPHPIEVPVPHLVAVPHYVQVPVKDYHPVFGPKTHKVHSSYGSLAHSPPHPPASYNHPHKENLHRALLKQHAGDAPPYGLGRYASGSVVRRPPFPPTILHHPHHPPFRGPARRPPQPPPPPPPPPRAAHRGKLRHLVIEYGGFRPPLVPSKQIDEDPALEVKAEAKTSE